MNLELDEFLTTRSLRSDDSLVDDMTADHVEALRTELALRLVFHEPSARKTRVWEALGGEMPIETGR